MAFIDSRGDCDRTFPSKKKVPSSCLRASDLTSLSSPVAGCLILSSLADLAHALLKLVASTGLLADTTWLCRRSQSSG
jgi:hypothetical protein